MIGLLQRLLGITPAQEPQSVRAEVNGVPYDVETGTREGTAVSIHLPRQRMIIEPARFRNDDEAICWSSNVGRWVHGLFQLRASAVDVGTRNDRLAAVFPDRVVTVDSSLAEQAVAILVQLRDEVLGEPLAITEQETSGPPAVETSIEIDGQTIEVTLAACRIDTDEEAGTLGNLDLTVFTTPSLPHETIREHVRLIVPGYDELLKAPAYAPLDGGTTLGFALLELAASLGFQADQKRQQWLWQMVKTLKQVDVVWAGNANIPIGTVPCVRSPAENSE